MNVDIFDREGERRYILDFLGSASKTLLVSGPSGVGKSVVVRACLSSVYGSSSVITYPFRPDPEQAELTLPFEDYLVALYGRVRPKWTNLQGIGFDGISLSPPMVGGISINFSRRKSTIIDSGFCRQLFRMLSEAKISALVLSNVEMANEREGGIIKVMSSSNNSSTKLIIEHGGIIRGKACIDEINNISFHPFNEAMSNRFYQFIHKSPPLPQIFNRTGGNALFIKHFDQNLDDIHPDLVSAKLDALSPDEAQILVILAIFGGVAKSTTLARHISQDISSALSSLLLKAILIEEGDAISFSHPLFNARARSIITGTRFKKIIADIIGKELSCGNNNLKALSALSHASTETSLIYGIGERASFFYARRGDYGAVMEVVGGLLSSTCLIGSEVERAMYTFAIAAIYAGAAQQVT